jgi:predicted outer membrane repeat protein
MSDATNPADHLNEIQTVETQIESSTRLSTGKYIVIEDVIVHKGATLTVAAGCELNFAPGTGIIVYGKLVARGSEQSKITFTGKSGWCGIYFTGPAVEGSRIEQAEFVRGQGRAPADGTDDNGQPNFEGTEKGRNKTGGALNLFHTSPATIQFDQVRFRTNRGARQGGAVAIDQGNASFNTCTFENNNADAGGAISLISGQLSLHSCTFTKNKAEVAGKSGGAIFASKATGRLEKNKFESNCGINGGAIYCQSASLQILENEFNENSASANGGAIVCDGDVLPEITKSRFTNNSADDEGGALYFHTDRQKALDLTGNSFEDNSAGTQGGALGCAPGSAARLNDCGFAHNKGQSDEKRIPGGAVYCPLGSHFSFTSCRFERNLGKNGGAICLGDGDPTDIESRTNATIFQSSFSGNTAYGNGGAVFLSPGSTLEIRDNCHFENNTANSQGGAVATASQCNLLLLNCDFAGNSAVRGGAVLWRGALGQINECSFIRNEAAESGGAIECLTTLSLVQCRFRKNSSRHKGGGALWIACPDITMDECEYENNETEGEEEGGAVRYLIDHGNLQDTNTFGLNRPNSIRYNKTRFPDGRGVKAKGKGGCWAVSAYYGDPDHPEVCRIRSMRDDLIECDPLGPAVSRLNGLYQLLGNTECACRWKNSLVNGNRTIPRRITGAGCRLLSRLARSYWSAR